MKFLVFLLWNANFRFQTLAWARPPFTERGFSRSCYVFRKVLECPTVYYTLASSFHSK